MPKMTDDDLARIRAAIRLRNRCREAVTTKAAELGWPMTPAQANIAYDVIRTVLAECAALDLDDPPTTAGVREKIARSPVYSEGQRADLLAMVDEIDRANGLRL